jgi:hypothetical protein
MSRPQILLIHGAFHGPRMWIKVRDRLEQLGWQVHTVELPSVAAEGQPHHGFA